MTHPASEAAERKRLFAALDRFIANHYGERCPTVHGGCPCCRAWAARDVLALALDDAK